MSISLLGYALSFFGHFSHDTTIVALSFTFLNVLKSTFPSLKVNNEGCVVGMYERVMGLGLVEDVLEEFVEFDCMASDFVQIFFL